MSEHEPYSNEYQKEAVEYLLEEGHTVRAFDNSEIDVYIKGKRGVWRTAVGLGPYNIDHVVGLHDESPFNTKVTLRADWTEVSEE